MTTQPSTTAATNAATVQPSGWITSLKGLGVTMLASTALVPLVSVVFWRMYDRARPSPFGLDKEMWAFVLAAYTPVIAASIVGYKDALFKIFDESDATRQLSVPIYYLFIGLAGVIIALGALVWVAMGMSDDDAKWFIGVAATIWGGTVGSVFERRFRRYVLPS